MDCIRALEEERKKILVFGKALPLSLQLVTQAIETCKQQQHQIVRNDGNSSEKTSSELGPVLEEFIPLRPSYPSSSDEENLHQKNESNIGSENKPDWMRSVQLWNQQPEMEGDVLRKPVAVNATKVGGAFRPFGKEKVIPYERSLTENTAAAAAATRGGQGGGCGSGEEKKEGKYSQRKARRCWSQELHHQFLHALQQLSGANATPKQIRELMKVDGLTNDEVKSHLQKYRLHTRRPAAAAAKNNDSSRQQAQIVLVGGLWVPLPAYASQEQQTTENSKGDQTNGTVYAPLASLPSQLASKQKYNGYKSTSQVDGERTNSNSSTTSSQTTASPPFI